MKIAKEIARAITAVDDAEQRVPALKKAMDEYRAEAESIISAKLGPVKKALKGVLDFTPVGCCSCHYCAAAKEAYALFEEE